MKKLQGLMGVALAILAVSAGQAGTTAVAAGPTTTNVTVVPPFMPPAVGVAGDFAPGYGNGSIAGDGIAKSELYLTPAALFGRDVTLSEITSMSYWTKKTGDHVTVPADWFLALYTKPYAGDASTPTWYGDRIGTEPYFSDNLVETAGAWNQWVTSGTPNKLRFFESTAGAPGANFGSYTDPDWATFVAANALSGLPRGTQQVLFFSVQTGSAWAAGFTGQVDGLSITLTDGSVANVNFEPVVPCTTTCYVNAATGNDAFGGDTPSTAKKTIQAAVSQVSAGGEVIVAAGAYAENVTIAQAVSLKGAQAGTATSGRTFSNAGESTLTGQITVNAANVTIDGFSLTNPGQPLGIVVKTAGNNAQIKNNFVQNVGALTLGGGGGAQAIYLEYGPDGVSITGNDIQNVSSDRSAKAILIGDSTSTDASENVTVEGNAISNITSAVRGAYGVTSNNKAGATNLIVRSNSISTLTGAWAHAIGLEGPTQSALVEKNTISNLGAAPDAIGVFFEDNPVYGTANVTANSFANMAAGIAVAPALATLDPGPVNGTCNWWSDASGPSGMGAGIGVAVAPNVTFLPWLLSSDLNGACAPAVVAGTLPSNASGDEGSTLTASGSFVGTNVVVTQQSGPGTVTDLGNGAWSWSYATDDNFFPTTVVVQATDVYGAVATESFEATAMDVAPTATFVVQSPVLPGGTYTLALINPSDVSSVDAAAGYLYAFYCGIDFVPFTPSNTTTCVAPLAGGTYAVSGIIMDKDDAEQMYTSSVVVGNQAVKVSVRNYLSSLLPTGDKKNDDAIKKAIESIDKSLKPDNWEDGTSLTDKGKKVFDEEKKAVQELSKVKNINLTSAINSLVQVDRDLAQSAINEVSCGTDDKCQKELAKAQKSLADGDTQAAKPDPDKAIDNYKKAWESAMKAMK